MFGSEVKEGQTFRRLKVTKILNKNYKGYTIVECLCACGKTVETSNIMLITGHSTSCRCLVKTPLHKVWRSMITRCYNTKGKAYKNYGGRGITVCNRWRESFWNFYDDMGDRPSDDHSLERINNSLGYSPDNCRWTTQQEQNQNKRTTRFTAEDIITIRKLYSHMTTIELARKYKVNQSTISRIVNKKRWDNI